MNLAKNQDEAKLIIENLLNSFMCWKNGFGNTVFNFTINNGLTKGGRAILIDLGEIAWNKEEIRKVIAKRIWENQPSFLNFKDMSLKAYIQRRFHESFTEANLELYWKYPPKKAEENILPLIA